MNEAYVRFVNRHREVDQRLFLDVKNSADQIGSPSKQGKNTFNADLMVRESEGLSGGGNKTRPEDSVVRALLHTVPNRPGFDVLCHCDTDSVRRLPDPLHEQSPCGLCHGAL